MTTRPRTATLLRHAIAAVLVLTCTIGGMTAALLAAGSDVQRTTLGTIETRIIPSLDGYVSVYVPLVDWRVRILEHDAPLHIELELRGIDRQRASQGLSSPEQAQRSIDELRHDSEQVIRAAATRAVTVAALGGLIGATIGGALVAGLLLRRRWLLIGPAIGVVVVTCTIVPTVMALRGLASEQLELQTTGTNAGELPGVLRFSQQLLTAGDEYEEHYRTALRSISNVASFTADTNARSRHASDSNIIVMSDLHANTFVLDALSDFSGDAPVLAVGDFQQVGAKIEERITSKVARLGSSVTAVSGNHDTAAFMDALDDAGADVLDEQAPWARIAGLEVAGFPDPLERPRGAHGRHVLRVYGAAYEAHAASLIEWYDSLTRHPDVVLIHQHGLVHRLVRHLKRIGDRRPVVILTGHDHVPHVHEDGPWTIVDSGTIGAGGIAAVGQQEASFARLNLVRGRVASVDVFSIEPIAGSARSERTVVDGRE